MVDALIYPLAGKWTCCTSCPGIGIFSKGQRRLGLLHWWSTRMCPTKQNCSHICPGENLAQTFVVWLIPFPWHEGGQAFCGEWRISPLCWSEEEVGLWRSKPVGQNRLVLLPPASVLHWRSIWRDPLIIRWGQERKCILQNWFLCLFPLSSGEVKSHIASSTAVFSVLGKMMEWRQWRVLSQSPIPCSGGLLGFSS